MTPTSSKITPCFWFNNCLPEATEFYKSIFPDSSVILSYTPAGKPFSALFTIAGQTFVGIQGNGEYHFSGGISMIISCKDQEEIDHFWDKLTADGGKGIACGWLTDKYGVTWQVMPEGWERWVSDTDQERRKRCDAAMRGMVKIDRKKLLEAYGEDA